MDSHTDSFGQYLPAAIDHLFGGAAPSYRATIPPSHAGHRAFAATANEIYNKVNLTREAAEALCNHLIHAEHLTRKAIPLSTSINKAVKVLGKAKKKHRGAKAEVAAKVHDAIEGGWSFSDFISGARNAVAKAAPMIAKAAQIAGDVAPMVSKAAQIASDVAPKVAAVSGSLGMMARPRGGASLGGASCGGARLGGAILETSHTGREKKPKIDANGHRPGYYGGLILADRAAKLSRAPRVTMAPLPDAFSVPRTADDYAS